MLCPRDLLAVRIGEDDGQALATEQLVIILLRVHAQADAFVLNRLAGAIERAVGEEDRLAVGRRASVRIGGVFLL